MKKLFSCLIFLVVLLFTGCFGYDYGYYNGYAPGTYYNGYSSQGYYPYYPRNNYITPYVQPYNHYYNNYYYYPRQYTPLAPGVVVTPRNNVPFAVPPNHSYYRR